MWHLMQQAKTYLEAHRPVALVTLVDASGSTYRKPGAKMVVDYEGKHMGTISGGCLENDVAHHAQGVLKEKRNQIIHYELDDDLVFGLGLGCGGSISLLIEGDVASWLPLVLATSSDSVVVKQINSADEDEEPKTVCVYEGGEIIWQHPEYPLESEEMLAYCAAALQEKSSLHGELRQQGKQRRFFFDFIQPAPSLVIFGGGDDALPVASFARQLDFEVTVIDYSPVKLAEQRFSGCTKILWNDSEQPLPQVNKHAAVIIMSHHVERDARALEVFSAQNVNYIGLLGPKKRLVKLESHFNQLTLADIEADQRIYAPIGLDIGSETPAEIAISILSEIIAVRNKAGGVSLRQKKGPIHQPAPCQLEWT